MEIFWIFFGVHTFNAVCMIEKVTKKKKERQHNLTKITGKTGEVLTSPKKDMYIMQGGEGKTRICKQYYTKKIEDWES